MSSVEEKFSGSVAISSKRAALGTGIVLIMITCFGIVRAEGLQTVNGELLPVDATAFIKNQNIEGPIFNDEAFGGYLIWQNWPQQKVFIDGRDEIYAGEVARDDVAIMTGASGWEKLVNEKYHINYFLLWYQPPLAGLVENLSNQLEQNLGFKLVYWDDTAIILARNDSQNRDLIKNFAYHYISPFVPANSIPIADRPAVVQEWERALATSSSTAMLQNYIR